MITEDGHHRVADGLDHAAVVRRDDIMQNLEMIADQGIGRSIADVGIERGGSAQIREQDDLRASTSTRVRSAK